MSHVFRILVCNLWFDVLLTFTPNHKNDDRIMQCIRGARELIIQNEILTESVRSFVQLHLWLTIRFDRELFRNKYEFVTSASNALRVIKIELNRLIWPVMRGSYLYHNILHFEKEKQYLSRTKFEERIKKMANITTDWLLRTGVMFMIRTILFHIFFYSSLDFVLCAVWVSTNILCELKRNEMQFVWINAKLTNIYKRTSLWPTQQQMK